MELIDKAAIVAEIERRKQTWQHQDQQYVNGGKDVCDYLLGFLDTLEVREKDSTDAFVKKACKWLKNNAYFYVNDLTGSLDEIRLIENFKKALEE
jgi:hypothetical protein